MKKLVVTDKTACMACLSCVEACSQAFYKEFDPAKSCIQIVSKTGTDATVKTCIPVSYTHLDVYKRQVEPWSALPSRDGIVEELTQQADLTRLDAGRSYETTWVITVE